MSSGPTATCWPAGLLLRISLGFERGVLGGGSKVTDSLWPAPPQPHSPPCPPCGVDQQRGKRLRVSCN
ncbi:hypothetical protein KUCAC02_012925 [Chaenocephalus aceratus]|uniref:Uncharacterized protein n=1 Tax=Chaenocephalus aceratus TaxID=36190 RepID=A0ACB9XD16_CHAAC|nr:hypothetical protein KUCAC02_012925 [Chaenocephalus aceratus]